MSVDRRLPTQHPAGERPVPRLRVGQLLKEYRKTHGLTQGQLGELLGVGQSAVSRFERGDRPVRDVEFLMQIARALEIPPAHLGLSTELVGASVSRPRGVQPMSRVTMCPSESHDATTANQLEWRAVRRHLNQNRHALARSAVRLYEPEWRVGETSLLARDAWLPSEPVPVEHIEMTWSAEHPVPAVTGTEPESDPVRPVRVPGHRYDRYTSAVRYLDPPSLFENRPSYRLLDLTWSADRGTMRFALATYFDKLDVAEALGHELALASMSDSSREVGIRDLPFRALVGDPFDATRRALLPAVTTLLLRRRRTHGTATFLLHWRDASKVATAAGVYDVIPAGEFQPSSVAVWDQANDFDIWRSIVREFSEELLGEPEHDGSSGVPIDYDAWPLYRTLQSARLEGRVAVYCLGAGVDALTLAPTILTVVVIDDDVFDVVLRDVVATNAEGIVVFDADGGVGAEGLPFDANTVKRFLEREPMASPGAACLSLAWRYRLTLLAP